MVGMRLRLVLTLRLAVCYRDLMVNPRNLWNDWDFGSAVSSILLLLSTLLFWWIKSEKLKIVVR